MGYGGAGSLYPRWWGGPPGGHLPVRCTTPDAARLEWLTPRLHGVGLCDSCAFDKSAGSFYTMLASRESLFPLQLQAVAPLQNVRSRKLLFFCFFFSHLSLNLSTDLISHPCLSHKRRNRGVEPEVRE